MQEKGGVQHQRISQEKENKVEKMRVEMLLEIT